MRLQFGSPQTGRGTPFFRFHAAFTEHKKKKKKKCPASCGVSDSDLKRGCGGTSAGRGGVFFNAVIDVKSDGPGAHGTSGQSCHCESLLVAAINHTAAF